MHKTPISRRALMNAGAGLAAVSVLGCSPASLSGGAAIPAPANASYPSSPLARNFVSVGVIRSASTAAAAAGFIDKADNKDLLFLPNLITDLEGPALAILAKSAQANGVWLAFRAERGQQRADILIDSTGDVLEIPQSDADLTAIPTPLGNIAFASGTPQASSEAGNAEIVLLTDTGDSYAGAYTISADAMVGPVGDIIETAANAAAPLISARIPIAGFRKLRAS